MFFVWMTVNRAHDKGYREEDNDTDDKETERNRGRISEFTEFFFKVVHGSFSFLVKIPSPTWQS